MQAEQAIDFIRANAEQHCSKTPTLGTLMEEIAELTRALEGKHEHHASLELIQIGGIVVNMLTRYAWTDADQAMSARERDAWRDAEQGPLKHGGRLFG